MIHNSPHGQEDTMRKLFAVVLTAIALAGSAFAANPSPTNGNPPAMWDWTRNSRQLIYGVDPAQPNDRSNPFAADRTSGAVLTEQAEASCSVYAVTPTLANGATVTVASDAIDFKMVMQPISTTETVQSDAICVSKISMAQAAAGLGTFVYVGQPYDKKSKWYAETLYLVSLRGQRTVGIRQGKK